MNRTSFKASVTKWLTKQPQKDHAKVLELTSRRFKMKMGIEEYIITPSVLNPQRFHPWIQHLKVEESLKHLEKIIQMDLFLTAFKPLYNKEGYKLYERAPQAIKLKGDGVIIAILNNNVLYWEVYTSFLSYSYIGGLKTPLLADHSITFNKLLQMVENHRVQKNKSESSLVNISKTCAKDSLLRNKVQLLKKSLQLNTNAGKCKVEISADGELNINLMDIVHLRKEELPILERFLQIIREDKLVVRPLKPIESNNQPVEEAGVKLV